ALADAMRQLAFAIMRAVELGPPLREGPAAVGHWRELERGHVVVHAQRRFQNRIGALEVVVGKGQELLANDSAVLQAEVPHAAHRARGHAALDPRLRHERRPLGQAVEVADLGPHRVRRRVDHARDVDLDHGLLADPGYSPAPGSPSPVRGITALWLRSSRPRATLPTSPESTPISRSNWSTRGACALNRSAEFTTLSAKLPPRSRLSPRPPPPPPRPSTWRILMPSIRSSGLTDSRMIASSFSISRMRMADSRASGLRRFCASFIIRAPSASTSLRILAAAARTRSAS